MKTEIFKNDKLKDALKEALEWCDENDGHIATVKEVFDLKKEGVIDKDIGYDTSTIFLNGEVRTATLEELENIQDVYDKMGRVLLISNYIYGLSGDNFLDNFGRFVGVAPEVHKYCKECGHRLKEVN